MITNFCDFCKNLAFFFKNKCYESNFAKNLSNLNKNVKIFDKKFGENIFKTLTSVPALTSWPYAQ
jgi:hypothetical protein